MNLFLRLAINKWKSFFKKTPQGDCKVCKGGRPRRVETVSHYQIKKEKKDEIKC